MIMVKCLQAGKSLFYHHFSCDAENTFFPVNNVVQNSHVSAFLRFVTSLFYCAVSSLCPVTPYRFLKKGVKDTLIVLKVKAVLLGIVVSCFEQELKCNNIKYFSKKMSHFETWMSLCC